MAAASPTKTKSSASTTIKSTNLIKRGKTGAQVKHRQLAVGWAVLTHNLWLVARMAEAEKKRQEDQEQMLGIASSRVV